MTEQEIYALTEASIIDPSLTQVKSLQLLGERNIPDTTNPFMFLLENSALLTSSALQSMSASLRSSYPILATSKDELYGHLNTTESNDIFSRPSEASFNIFIAKNEAIRFGEVFETHTLLTIPKFSNITVNDVIFTLLNDIEIYIYPDNRIFAKYNHNTLDISMNNDQILTSGVTTDKDGKEWVYVNPVIKQIRRYTFKDSILETSPYNTDINLNGNEMFTHLTAKTINNNTGRFSTVETTFSDYVYNPDRVTLRVRPEDNVVKLLLPITYLVSGLASSYIDVELYSTLGKQEISLSTYKTTDFVFKAVLPTTNNKSIIGINNIPIKVTSNDFTSGGLNEISFLDLKNKIIDYATGDNNIPITISELKSSIESYGFRYRGINKRLLKSSVLITKKIGKLNYPVRCPMEITTSDIKLILGEITSSKITYTDKNLVINPFQLFKNIDNLVTPLSNTERDEITSLASNDITEYNKHKIYFNLYKYVMDYSTELRTRVYDVNTPTIDNLISLYMGPTLLAPIVVTDHTISNLGDSYEIVIQVASSTVVDDLNIDKVFVQLSYQLDNNDTIEFKGTAVRNATGIAFTSTINVDTYINNEHMLDTDSGDGELNSALLNLVSNMTCTIYSTDNSLTSPETRDISSIVLDEATLILYEETFDVNFGIYLEYLYTHYNIDYTARKFAKHTTDLYDTYDKNVYELDADGTVMVTPIDTTGDGNDDDVELSLLHSEGDIKYDVNGDPIYIHRIGDIIIDPETLLPVVDPNLGVMHSFNIMLLEDVFLRTTDTTLVNYRREFFKSTTLVLTEDIEPIHNQMLDDISIKFMSDNIIKPVTLGINDTLKNYDTIFSPVIDCYVHSDTTTVIDDVVLDSLHSYLDNGLENSDPIGILENGIKDIIGQSVLYVKLTGFSDEVNVLNYTTDSSKFTIKKVLTKDDSGNNIIVPDIKVNILSV